LGTIKYRYGTLGNPITKASVAYDSGWVDITYKAGQYFNITYNLNGTDLIVGITEKTTINDGLTDTHQDDGGVHTEEQTWTMQFL